ncbi:TPA: hypothetical protein ACNKK1_003080 [Enterococcus faecalis]
MEKLDTTKNILKKREIQISNTIYERPKSANNRSEIGHWEADTVAGKTGGSCLVYFD